MIRTADQSPPTSPIAEEVSTYMEEASRYPLLSADEERELCHRAFHGDQAATARLTECNLRLVLSIALKYFSRVSLIDQMDLIQEGNLGLMKAVEKFDPRRGVRFSTLAVVPIKQRILRFLHQRNVPVHIPVNPGSDLARVKYAFAQLYQELHRTPTPDEIAEETGLSRAHVVNVLPWISPSCHSLDMVLSNETTQRYADIITDPDDDYMDIETAIDQQALVAKLLAMLPENDRKVIEKYYGLSGEEAVNDFGPIANEFHFSRQRAWQLHKRSINHMRFALNLVPSEPISEEEQPDAAANHAL